MDDLLKGITGGGQGQPGQTGGIGDLLGGLMGQGGLGSVLGAGLGAGAGNAMGGGMGSMLGGGLGAMLPALLPAVLGMLDGKTGAGQSGVLFDPETGQWTAAPPMPEPRAGGAAVTLGDGAVLIVGGYTHTMPRDESCSWGATGLTGAVLFIPGS